MMLQIGDDGAVSKVDEEELIYVDKKELEELIERYTHLEEENEKRFTLDDEAKYIMEYGMPMTKELIERYTHLEEENEKRFTLDDEARYIMEYGMPMTIFDVIMMLNEQQATIQSLKEENEQLKNKLNESI